MSEKMKLHGVLAVALALAGVLLQLQGCSRDNAVPRMIPVGTTGAVSDRTVIPAGKSVSAVNSALLGRYEFWRKGCFTSEGSIPVLSDGSGEGSTAVQEKVVIQDKVFTRKIYHAESDCLVTAAFPLLGLDQKKLVVGKPVLTVIRSGVVAGAEECGVVMSKIGAAELGTYEYVLDDLALHILGAPREPCLPNEKDDRLFSRI